MEIFLGEVTDNYILIISLKHLNFDLTMRRFLTQLLEVTPYLLKSSNETGR